MGKLNIPQMLLGTSPVILVSIIPQTLVGVLLTKEGATSGVWGMISTAATGVAAAVQAGATLTFSYGIMRAVEQHGSELAKEREEHSALAELTKKEAAYVQTYRDISEWSGLLGPQKATILLATVLLLFSGFVMAADFMMSEEVCFKAFAITDRIGDADELGGLDSNA